MPEAQQFPEHEKMKAVKDRSQSIGEFLEWLREEKGYVVCEKLRTSDDEEDEDYELAPANLPVERLLADFFEIDLNKIEDEKRAMLDQLRAANSQR